MTKPAPNATLTTDSIELTEELVSTSAEVDAHSDLVFHERGVPQVREFTSWVSGSVQELKSVLESTDKTKTETQPAKKDGVTVSTPPAWRPSMADLTMDNLMVTQAAQAGQTVAEGGTLKTANVDVRSTKRGLRQSKFFPGKAKADFEPSDRIRAFVESRIEELDKEELVRFVRQHPDIGLATMAIGIWRHKKQSRQAGNDAARIPFFEQPGIASLLIFCLMITLVAQLIIPGVASSNSLTASSALWASPLILSLSPPLSLPLSGSTDSRATYRQHFCDIVRGLCRKDCRVETGVQRCRLALSVLRHSSQIPISHHHAQVLLYDHCMYIYMCARVRVSHTHTHTHTHTQCFLDLPLSHRAAGH